MSLAKVRKIPRSLLLWASVAWCLPGEGAASFASDEEARFRAALGAYRSGAIRESVRILEELTRASPRKALYWFNLGNSHLREGSHAEAIRAYDRVIALDSPLAVPSQLYRALCHRKLGRVDLALKALKKLEERPMGPGLAGQVRSEMEETRAEFARLWLKHGIELYQRERYAEAARSLRYSAEYAQSEEAQLMRGMALLKLGRTREAREVLSRTARSGGDSAALIQEIDQGKWELRSPLFLAVDLSGGYNTNVFGGSPIDALVAEPVASIALIAGYRFFLDESFWLRPEYQVAWDEVVGLPAFRGISQAVQARLTYQTSDWLVQAVPSFQHQILGADPYVQRHGAEARVERQLGDFRLGLSGSAQVIVSRSETYAYLAGQFRQARFFGAWQGANYDLNLGVQAADEAIGDLVLDTGLLPAANLSYGPTAGASWFPSRSWGALANFSYLYRDYKTLEQPNGTKRVDRQLGFELRVVHGLGGDLTLYASGAAILNQSTMDDASVENKNYNQAVFKLGLSWDPYP